ncbi:MAG: carbohydrate ABC transporter permease [Anaerolineae bacterium]|nr:carbohydrate ABC transporter permease [Anaerolineae bacterium]MCB0243281.1 carbohydrate ABC transporter permease [Anaerolineae bacterium]MCB0251456.1 carbohydrate ABC transporter permease [Anaerolineae bacterium]MCB9142706.1 carbohydrate ABC transporter permease [Anaerolineales bacterium]MCO5246352.1 carbohydrate ABC transporter permease [Anaerolineae bacterium]
MRSPKTFFTRFGIYAVLLLAMVMSLFPIVLVIMNSLKTRKAIFSAPWMPPTPDTFSLGGYETVLARSNFGHYFVNSLTVTLTSMFLILLLGAMAAFALSEYSFRGDALLGLYLAIGIMIPIRLGTVSILRLVVALHLVNTLVALILVYTAMGLPLAIFILTQFMRQVPMELKDAARIDGASEYRIFRIVLPLVSPAVATVAVFTIVPIWNDLWFPLILAPGDSTKTVTLGAQQFLGQFVSDWNAVLSSLTLAMLPVLIIFILFSRQLIKGLTAGAIK